MEGCVSTDGRPGGGTAGGGSGPAPGPDGGARLTAPPASGTEAGGTGGGRSLKSWALAGTAKKASQRPARTTAKANAGHTRLPRRHRKMPSLPDFMSLLLTENAANSSLPGGECDRQKSARNTQTGEELNPQLAIQPYYLPACGINHARDRVWRGPAAGIILGLQEFFSVLDILSRRNHNDSDTGEKVGLGSIRRPVIGLALGGGAARGFAHIGIIKTLLAHGIVPNVVVGTSIGAVVGGAYAAGHLDTLEQWARSLQMRNILGYLDIRLNGSGLIGGDKLAAQLEASIGNTMIEDLPCKFASVATEVRTGHEIWLTHGRVVDAMRASYALPGIFAPVLIGDRWLVDGALVNPVPVSAARALGAEIVIAANLSSDIFTHSTTIYAHGALPPATGETEAEPAPSKRRFGKFFSPERTVKREFFGGRGRPGISSVMVDAFNIMQDRITRARIGRRSAGSPDQRRASARSAGSTFIAPPISSTMACAPPSAPSNSIQEAIHVLAPPGPGAVKAKVP